MTNENQDMNGSVHELAEAMQAVFTASVRDAIAPLESKMATKDDIASLEEIVVGLEREIKDEMEKQRATTDENVHAQLAQRNNELYDRFSQQDEKIDELIRSQSVAHA